MVAWLRVCKGRSVHPEPLHTAALHSSTHALVVADIIPTHCPLYQRPTVVLQKLRRLGLRALAICHAEAHDGVGRHVGRSSRSDASAAAARHDPPLVVLADEACQRQSRQRRPGLRGGYGCSRGAALELHQHVPMPCFTSWGRRSSICSLRVGCCIVKRQRRRRSPAERRRWGQQLPRRLRSDGACHASCSISGEGEGTLLKSRGSEGSPIVNRWTSKYITRPCWLGCIARQIPAARVVTSHATRKRPRRRPGPGMGDGAVPRPLAATILARMRQRVIISATDRQSRARGGRGGGGHSVASARLTAR